MEFSFERRKKLVTDGEFGGVFKSHVYFSPKMVWRFVRDLHGLDRLETDGFDCV